MSYSQIIVVAGTIILVVALTYFVQRTQTGQGDARGVVRPGGGVDDGHRRRPRDRRDLLHRLRARGRGRCLQLHLLSAGVPDHGLPGRALRVHGRRGRRDRQPAGLGARRPPDRARRGVLDRLHLVDVLAGDRLRDPDRGDARPPERPARQRRRCKRSDGRRPRHRATRRRRRLGRDARGAPRAPRRHLRPRRGGAPASPAARVLSRASASPRRFSRSSRATATSSASASTRCSTCCSRSA